MPPKTTTLSPTRVTKLILIQQGQNIPRLCFPWNYRLAVIVCECSEKQFHKEKKNLH